MRTLLLSALADLTVAVPLFLYGLLSQLFPRLAGLAIGAATDELAAYFLRIALAVSYAYLAGFIILLLVLLPFSQYLAMKALGSRQGFARYWWLDLLLITGSGLLYLTLLGQQRWIMTPPGYALLALTPAIVAALGKQSFGTGMKALVSERRFWLGTAGVFITIPLPWLAWPWYVGVRYWYAR